jgi:hypothetical protein
MWPILIAQLVASPLGANGGQMLGKEFEVVQIGKVQGVLVSDAWKPSREDAAKLEAGLVDYIRRNPPERSPRLWRKLKLYRRQYIGITRDGRRFIRCIAFCDAAGLNWKRQIVVVFDGGDCYFEIDYDVDSGTYSNLYVHGEA